MKYFTKVKIFWKLWMICLFTATGILQGASAKAEDGFHITTTRPVAADYEKWIRAEAYDKNGDLVGKDQIYFSKLPVLYMNTENEEEITTKTEYKNSTLRIQGNTLYDQQYDGQAQVKLRGNSSIGFPQKPYKIKLGKGTNLFGFGKNKHWVLLSSFMDQCALRNRIGSDLSAWLGLTNMQMTWVDVVINDSIHMFLMEMHQCGSLLLTVDTASSAVCKLAVYVNGLHRGDYEITGGSGSFSVDSKYLTGEKGTHNAVSVLGCDEKGNVIYCVYVAHGRKNSSKKYTSFRCIKTTRKTKAVHKGVKKDFSCKNSA